MTDRLTVPVIPFSISTHTPLARRDAIGAKILSSARAFQLTRLLRGVTSLPTLLPYQFVISTHTPLARRDEMNSKIKTGVENISTHTPLARRDENC